MRLQPRNERAFILATLPRRDGRLNLPLDVPHSPHRFISCRTDAARRRLGGSSACIASDPLLLSFPETRPREFGGAFILRLVLVYYRGREARSNRIPSRFSLHLFPTEAYALLNEQSSFYGRQGKEMEVPEGKATFQPPLLYERVVYRLSAQAPAEMPYCDFFSLPPDDGKKVKARVTAGVECCSTFLQVLKLDRTYFPPSEER